MGFASSVSHSPCPFLDATMNFHCQTTLNSSSGPVLLLLFKQNYSYKCSWAFSSQNKPVLLKLFQYSVSASWFIWTEVEQRVITLYTWLADLRHDDLECCCVVDIGLVITSSASTAGAGRVHVSNTSVDEQNEEIFCLYVSFLFILWSWREGHNLGHVFEQWFSLFGWMNNGEKIFS